MENNSSEFEYHVCFKIISFLDSTQFKTDGFSCLAYFFCDDYWSSSDYDDAVEYYFLYLVDFWGIFKGSQNAFFDFNITDGHFSMIITNKDGNQAYYSDEPMSISSQRKTK